MYAVFTFLAGFSSHKFIAWLDRLADKIFSTTLPEEKNEKRMQVENAAAVDRLALKSEISPVSDAAPPTGVQENIVDNAAPATASVPEQNKKSAKKIR